MAGQLGLWKVEGKVVVLGSHWAVQLVQSSESKKAELMELSLVEMMVTKKAVPMDI